MKYYKKIWIGFQLLVLFFGISIWIGMVLAIPIDFLLNGHVLLPCSGMGDCSSMEELTKYSQIVIIMSILVMIYHLFLIIKHPEIVKDAITELS